MCPEFWRNRDDADVVSRNQVALEKVSTLVLSSRSILCFVRRLEQFGDFVNFWIMFANPGRRCGMYCCVQNECAAVADWAIY